MLSADGTNQRLPTPPSGWFIFPTDIFPPSKVVVRQHTGGTLEISWLPPSSDALIGHAVSLLIRRSQQVVETIHAGEAEVYTRKRAI